MSNKNSKARIEANNRYNAKAYDHIHIVVPKGAKEKIQYVAELDGLSMNAYVNKLINADIEQRKTNQPEMKL